MQLEQGIKPATSVNTRFIGNGLCLILGLLLPAYITHTITGYSTMVVLVLAIGYFIPTLIAFSRDHKNRNAICALNVLLGWTCLGWIGALIWSLTK